MHTLALARLGNAFKEGLLRHVNELPRFGADGGGSTGGSTGETPATPCLEKADERCVFFQAPSGWGKSANAYMWINGTETKLVGAWPGKAATALGGGTFKFVIPDDVTGDETKWKIIWNGPSGQTVDMDFAMRGLYTVTGDKTDKYPASSTSTVTILCADVSTAVDNVALSRMQMYCMGGVLYIDTPEDLEMNLYTATGMLVRHLELHSGVNAVEGLQKGVYIGGGQKVIVY